jgi:hypothetical protein
VDFGPVLPAALRRLVRILIVALKDYYKKTGYLTVQFRGYRYAAEEYRNHLLKQLA